jgi:hypothetical protein
MISHLSCKDCLEILDILKSLVSLMRSHNFGQTGDEIKTGNEQSTWMKVGGLNSQFFRLQNWSSKE